MESKPEMTSPIDPAGAGRRQEKIVGDTVFVREGQPHPQLTDHDALQQTPPRYDLRIDADQGRVFIEEIRDEDGAWVKWEDIARPPGAAAPTPEAKESDNVSK